MILFLARFYILILFCVYSDGVIELLRPYYDHIWI